MVDEQVFLNESGISVSNSRVMSVGQTYAMSGITSAKTLKKTPSRTAPIVLIVIGLLSLAAGESTIVFGLILLAGGIAWWVMSKPDYSVLLTSASGVANAYTSKDKEFVSKIVGAVNNAIDH